jgi:aspartyl-tRNA(Asn)/glutamyl-tRNA(Gln) amidotransferase subunit A
LMPAEVSTNLARFDWIKFWLQEGTMNFDNIQKYYEKIRSEWFGDETKRRILLWTFVLSSANYEWYYLKAQKAREKLKSDFDKLFTKYDIILTPTSPEPAWKIWERTNDPLKMYLADIYTVPANIAWLPAMSVPIWNIEKDNQSLPVWIQIMANKREENKIFELGKIIEEIGN